jgi:hypothetical protein
MIMPWRDPDDEDVSPVEHVLGRGKHNPVPALRMEAFSSLLEPPVVVAPAVEKWHGTPGSSSSTGIRPAKPVLRAEEGDEVRRTRALESWWSLLRLDVSQTVTGKQLHNASDKDEEMLILKYTVSSKSTNTLICRQPPINIFFSWRASGDRLWMPDEQTLYDFMSSRAGGSNPKSRALATLEAFRFIYYTFQGPAVLKEAIESPRLVGFANEKIKELGLRKQATTLSLESLLVCENIVYEHALEEVKLTVLGGCLCLPLLRGRKSDCKLILDHCLEKTVVWIQVKATETSGSDRLPLYLMGPRVGASGLDWLSSYLQFREELNIGLLTHPLFPAFVGGSWTTDCASTADVNNYLRAALLECGVREAPGVSTHSMKAALLEYSSKFGLSEEVRRALGYHKGSSNKMIRVYARDTLSFPVTQLECMMSEIRMGRFNPDLKGEARWCGTQIGETKSKAASDIDGDNGDSDSYSSSDSSCLDVSDDQPSDAENARIDSSAALTASLTGQSDVRDVRFYQNTETGKTHRGKSGHIDALACGNAITNNVQRIASGAFCEYDDDNSLCRTCFGRALTSRLAFKRSLSDPILPASKSVAIHEEDLAF